MPHDAVQVMPMPERFELAERVKAKANALVKAGKHRFARARYDRMLRLMESTRDFETQVGALVSEWMLGQLGQLASGVCSMARQERCMPAGMELRSSRVDSGGL